jgi:hypothetical protein
MNLSEEVQTTGQQSDMFKINMSLYAQRDIHFEE